MSGLIAEFTVVGVPVPQGSMQAFVRGGKPRLVANNQGPLEKWRGEIRAAVRQYGVDHPASRFAEIGNSTSGAVSMRLAFRLPRPQSHFLPATKTRPAGLLREDAPRWAPGGKDLDKLVRAVLDALTFVVYLDDGQVVSIGATKEYAGAFTNAPHEQQPGVDVRVVAL